MARRTALDKFMFRKLAALSALLNMFERAPLEQDLLVGALIGVCTPDRGWWQRAGCAILLDHGFPEWRKYKHLVRHVLKRTDGHLKDWRKAVLQRDKHTCTKCGSTENLHAHHILPWAKYPELRIVVDNGTTLCRLCHNTVHGDLNFFVSAIA